MIKIWAPDTHHVLTKSQRRKSTPNPGWREQKVERVKVPFQAGRFHLWLFDQFFSPIKPSYLKRPGRNHGLLEFSRCWDLRLSYIPKQSPNSHEEMKRNNPQKGIPWWGGVVLIEAKQKFPKTPTTNTSHKPSRTPLEISLRESKSRASLSIIAYPEVGIHPWYNSKPYILLMVQKSCIVEVGSLSHCLQGFSTTPGGAGFYPSTVSRCFFVSHTLEFKILRSSNIVKILMPPCQAMYPSTVGQRPRKKDLNAVPRRLK